MGILDWIGMGKNLGHEISEPIQAISTLYTTDKQRLDAEQKLQETITKAILAQLDINKTLASSSSMFTSGWQPLIGWTAGLLILLYYAPQIIITTYVWAKNCIGFDEVIQYPMPSTDIMNLIYLVFGFGIYHIANRKLNH